MEAVLNNCLRRAAEGNPYLRWRAANLQRCALGEKPDQRPPEALLQRVWLYQRLLLERLQTSDGRKVRVLHPGVWNHEPGPDFRKAVIQIGRRGTAMNKKALEVAKAIGPVEVDYGGTSCKVPDAIKSLTAPRLHASFA